MRVYCDFCVLKIESTTVANNIVELHLGPPALYTGITSP